jgi:hypothetical protein
MVCQRFHPVYGMPVGEPPYRYCLDGENIQTPMMIPRIAAIVPKPEVQITNCDHSCWCFRNGVK